MASRERYLHFDNIDVSLPLLTSECSACKAEFSAAPKAEERIDDVLLRMRRAFDNHICKYGLGEQIKAA